MIHLALFAMLQGPTPPVTIPRVEADVRVDGVLDEPVWQQAAVLGSFHQYEPIDGRPAEEQTEVRVWYAPDAIYFGIHAHDQHPDRIRATRADRDNIDGEDHIVIYLDTFNDHRRAFMFGVNPLGVQMDGVRTEGQASASRMFGGSIDTNPDFIFESHGHLTSDGYEVEMRIPFKTLRFQTTNAQTWGLQIERVTQRTGYTDTWTDVRRASASYLLQAGSITGLHDMHRGVVIEAQPFVTLAANGALDAANAFQRDDPSPDAGANIKLSFPSITLDATINPDFSQVEADAGQVTINQRFALFFPEKRPFFLEGIELFSTPNQLVYTRQIVDPIAGGKVSGKIGPIGIAHLTALDQDVDGLKEDGGGGHDALFNVTRLRRDFGSNSLIGLTATDRSVLSTNRFNRVLAGDTRIVFGKLYYFLAQAGGSWTRDGGTSSETKFGQLWRAELDRTGRSWGFNYALNGTGQDFITRAGFVNRNDVVQASGFNRLTYYGRKGAPLETITTFFGPTLLWRYEDFMHDSPMERTFALSSTFLFRHGWNSQLSLGRNGIVFQPSQYAGYTVYTMNGPAVFTPLHDVSSNSVTLTLNTPTFQRFNANVGFGYGGTPIYPEAASGRSTDATASISLRPTTSTRVALSSTYERITRTVDGSEFARAIIPRIRADYQPKRSLFFRAILEYDAERRAALFDSRTGERLLVGGQLADATQDNGLRTDLLLSFTPTPGTVAYLGYGSSRADLRCGTAAGCSAFDFGELDRVNDGIFIKLAYLFRR